MEINKRLRVAKYGYVTLSALICVFGMLVIIKPDISFALLRIIVSIFMIVSAFFRVFGYLSKDRYRLAFQYDLAFGFISLILGCIVISRKDLSVSTVYFTMGLYIIADSLFKLQIAIDAREFGLKRWWLILAAAAAASVTGLVLIIMAYRSYTALIVHIGIAVLADGVLNLITVLTAVNILQKKLTKDVDFNE